MKWKSKRSLKTEIEKYKAERIILKEEIQTLTGALEKNELLFQALTKQPIFTRTAKTQVLTMVKWVYPYAQYIVASNEVALPAEVVEHINKELVSELANEIIKNPAFIRYETIEKDGKYALVARVELCTQNGYEPISIN